MSTPATNIPTISDAWALCEAVRAGGPLVQNITNYVAMTISANALLAAGASPAMVHAQEEATDFVAISSALCINIGTLSSAWVVAMKASAKAAHETGKPWVLDPVGCGATSYRTDTACALANLHPTIIRANASEIIALAHACGAIAQDRGPGADAGEAGPKGVDSMAAADAAIESARALAIATGSVVAITGETDYVVDATGCDALRIVAIAGGDALMPRSTAIGCALSGLCAAYAAVGDDPFAAAVAALAVYGAAGAIAAKASQGPGDIPAKLCNALHAIDKAGLEANATILPARGAR